MESRSTRAQRASKNREKASPIAATPITPSATPPAPALITPRTAAAPSPSPSYSQSLTRAPASDWIGIINIPSLTSMTAILKQSNHPADAALLAWTQATYLTPPVQPHGEGRPVATSEEFYKLLDVYKRVRILTNNTVPAKWPFFTRDYRKEMTMKEARLNAQVKKGGKGGK